MKSKMVKIIALGLSVTILATAAVYAATTNSKSVLSHTHQNQTTETSTGSTDESDKKNIEKNDRGNSNYKDETVYVIADADGTVQKIIVSDWIKNTLSDDKINDVSELKNIENIKGSEEYVLGSNNTCVWDAQGNDIYYQGNIEKELPVDLYVSYKLDGQSINPDELIGKSGKVTIRFDYRNKQYEMVQINGKEEKIYVPFAMLTGMLLDNSTFSNIEVSNGKIINDGDKTAVIGLALPGFQESLALDKDQFEIPSYVEITADVTDFSLGMTVTVATNTLFNEMNTEKIQSISDLSDLTESMKKLDEAMAKLLDGSSALYDGICTLLDKSSDLVQGINSLAEGASRLKDGAFSLDNGVKKLSDGVTSLSNGLSTLETNNDTLNNGAKKVFDSLLSTATTQLTAAGFSVPPLTINNYASVLNKLIKTLDDTNVYNQALMQVSSAVEGKRDYIKSQVTEAVRQQVEASVTSAVKEQITSQVKQAIKEQISVKVTEEVRQNIETQVILNVTGMNRNEYEAAVSKGKISNTTQDTILSAINQKMASEEVKAMISSNTESQAATVQMTDRITQKVEEQMKNEQTKNLIKANTDAKMSERDIQALIAQNTENQIQKLISENMSSEEVQSKITVAAEGAQSLIALKTSLDDYNAFYLGLMKYTEGVAQATQGAAALKSGADELKNGTSTLCSGISQLYNGILTMKNNAPALTAGISQLRDGSMRLSDGLSQFSKQGIEKLVHATKDTENLIPRLKAILDVSKNYKSFAGISENSDGNVKFVYKTAEIK